MTPRFLAVPGLVRGVALGATLLVATGCATVDPWTDARIESEVKARLVAQKDANLTRLGVVSSNGTVYLTGTVASADDSARAESVARGVTNVRRVVNGLQVRADTR
jgi:osmotically-inducible protein OsmY